MNIILVCDAGSRPTLLGPAKHRGQWHLKIISIISDNVIGWRCEALPQIDH